MPAWMPLGWLWWVHPLLLERTDLPGTPQEARGPDPLQCTIRSGSLGCDLVPYLGDVALGIRVEDLLDNLGLSA